jgi:hypothetical protein
MDAKLGNRLELELKNHSNFVNMCEGSVNCRFGIPLSKLIRNTIDIDILDIPARLTPVDVRLRTNANGIV